MYILSFDLEEEDDEENDVAQGGQVVLTVTNGFDRLYKVELSF